MITSNKEFFMMNQQTGKHHTKPNRSGLWKNFPDTCTNFGITRQHVFYVDPHDKKLSETSFGLPTEVRMVSTSKGIVVVLYFDHGQESHIIFVAQIKPKRGAWQNIDWEPGFHLKWDIKRIQDAVNNFLWVADCEEAKQILPRKNYIG